MTKFSEPTLNNVESNEGWCVEFIPRRSDVIKYIDGARVTNVDSEMLASSSDYDMVIYVDSIQKWLNDFEEKTISKAERKKIVANIICALEFKGYKADVVDS